MILKKEKGIKNLIFDTCGVGYFEVRKGYEPDAASLNEMLQKGHIAKGVKVTSCAQTDVPVAAEIFELSITGLG